MPSVDAGKAWQNLTFDLVGGNDAGFFSIATVPSAQGAFAAGAQILLTAAGAAQSALDFEVTPSYSLQLRVRDNLGLSATGTLALSINNRNEPPVFNSGFTPQPGTNQALPAYFVWENATHQDSVGAALSVSPGLVDPEDALGAGLSRRYTSDALSVARWRDDYSASDPLRVLPDLGDALVLDVGAIHHPAGALLFLRDEMGDVHPPLDQIHDQPINLPQVFAQLHQIRHKSLRLWRRLQ
jgi:hypothetical protein